MFSKFKFISYRMNFFSRDCKREVIQAKKVEVLFFFSFILRRGGEVVVEHISETPFKNLNLNVNIYFFSLPFSPSRLSYALIAVPSLWSLQICYSLIVIILKTHRHTCSQHT